MSKMLEPNELTKDILETPSLMTGKSPAKEWMDTPAEFRPGNWCYSAKTIHETGLQSTKIGSCRRIGRKLSVKVSGKDWISFGLSGCLWTSVSDVAHVRTSVISSWEAVTRKICRSSGLNCSDPSIEMILPLPENC